jgi:hypothetical protein
MLSGNWSGKPLGTRTNVRKVQKTLADFSLEIKLRRLQRTVSARFPDSSSGFVVERKVNISCCFPKGRMPYSCSKPKGGTPDAGLSSAVPVRQAQGRLCGTHLAIDRFSCRHCSAILFRPISSPDSAKRGAGSPLIHESIGNQNQCKSKHRRRASDVVEYRPAMQRLQVVCGRRLG